MNKLKEKLKSLSKAEMKTVNGGMRWTSDRGCNVLDLRGGRTMFEAQMSQLWCKMTNW